MAYSASAATWLSLIPVAGQRQQPASPGLPPGGSLDALDLTRSLTMRSAERWGGVVQGDLFRLGVRMGQHASIDWSGKCTLIPPRPPGCQTGRNNWRWSESCPLIVESGEVVVVRQAGNIMRSVCGHQSYLLSWVIMA